MKRRKDAIVFAPVQEVAIVQAAFTALADCEGEAASLRFDAIRMDSEGSRQGCPHAGCRLAARRAPARR